jgi:CDGSH-type Zn-finger protein
VSKPLCTCGLSSCSYCKDTANIVTFKATKGGPTRDRVDALRALLDSGVSTADRRFDREQP